jgi:cell division protein FtsW
MLRPGHVIALCVLALLMLGVVMVNSALMQVGHNITIESVLLSKSTVYMALSVLAMMLAARLPLFRYIPGAAGQTPPTHDSRWGGWTLKPLWIGAVALIVLVLLVYLPGLGRHVNGSSRWLSLPLPGAKDLSVQPSEIAKWALIALTAWYCWRMRDRLGSFLYGLLPALAAMGIVALVIVKEDLGTAVLIAAVTAVILMAAGARLLHFGLMLPAAGLAFAAAVIANPYRLDRIRSFLDPYQDPQGKGYHMLQSMMAVANGGVFGRGLGNGLYKFGYLPEDATDFIFAIICEELGLFGAGLVMMLYAGLVWAGLAIVRKQQSLTLRLIGLGIVATVGLQAIINMAVVTGLGPTKGIALPLISSGGTGWMLTAASLGLLIALDKATETASTPSTPRGEAIIEAKPTATLEPVATA